ncbi:MAG: hypothetical protein R6V42_09425, partial [Orrella sp.]
QTLVGHPQDMRQDKHQDKPNDAQSVNNQASPTGNPRSAAHCEEGKLDPKPLQDMLSSQETARVSSQSSSDFSAYGVEADDTDPLVKVLHELIDHTARQDARIAELCRAVESMGKKVEQTDDGSLDADRLNKLVD